MIDSHCHLGDEAFHNDLSAVILRARTAGITHALCILAAGNTAEIERVTMARLLWSNVRTSVGVHPHQAGEFAGRESDAAALVASQIAEDPAARAVGEIGLDYHYDFAPKDVQQRVFREQIRLAQRLRLPIVIHTREAEEDTLAILRDESGGRVAGVLHCFTGSRRLAEEGLALGLHISFSGIITFPKAAELRAIASEVPLDRLLCETDSPYLAPTPFRGKRNEPAYVARVIEEAAAVRGAPVTEVAQQISSNFAALFQP
jgi:TatD DNase family protein